MNREYGWLRSLRPAARGTLLLAGIAALLVAACSSPGSEDELRREIQGLKTEVAVVKEKLAQLQTGQQEILALLQKAAAAPPAAPAPAPAPAAAPQAMMLPAPPPAAPPISVGELLAGKDKYLGTRVTVKGMVGPVMVHHKSLLLKSPQGMVEVLLARLPDQKQVQQLTSIQLDRPLTVTGVVNLPAHNRGGAQVQIDAEAVEF